MGVLQGGGLAQGSGGVKRQRTAGKEVLGGEHLHCGQGRQPPQALQSQPRWRMGVEEGGTTLAELISCLPSSWIDSPVKVQSYVRTGCHNSVRQA